MGGVEEVGPRPAAAEEATGGDGGAVRTQCLLSPATFACIFFHFARIFASSVACYACSLAVWWVTSLRSHPEPRLSSVRPGENQVTL